MIKMVVSKLNLFAPPQNKFNSLLEVFATTLAHEQEVSTRFYNIINIALEEKEHSTKSFL